MSVVSNLSGASNFVLQEALGAYSDEAYTAAKKLSGTGIVGSNPNINTDTETFIGQMRWFKPLNPQINVASLTNPADGSGTIYSSDYLTYVKSVRTHGATKVNMQSVVTQQDGLAKIGRDFGETRSQDEHNAILSVLRGVALSEALNGAGEGSGAVGLGGQTFDNDPTDGKYGFYVDLGAAKNIVDATATVQGAARAEGLLRAMGMAWKDIEPEYVYAICSPATIASMRSANLVDQDRVTEGNINFQTIFGGKVRLIQTRAAQGFSVAELAKINTGVGVNITGTQTTFLVLPSALALEQLTVPDDVEIERKAAAYKGGGTTSIWYRWGYILHPAGYSWVGSQDVFAANEDYTSVMEGTNQVLLPNVVSGTMAATGGVWKRKATSALSLGILPVFHS